MGLVSTIVREISRALDKNPHCVRRNGNRDPEGAPAAPEDPERKGTSD
jgi:hypothetical protein